MNVYFTIYSPILLQGRDNTDSYREAVECGAVIKTNIYDSELIVSKLSKSLAEAVIAEHIADTPPDDYDLELLPLDGGLRIEYQHQVIERQCCSEINDYQNWEKVIENQSKEWKEIWIGHPSIYYRICDGDIQLSNYYDDSPSEEKIEPKLIINKDEFFEKLKLALTELKKFKTRLYTIINKGDFQNKEVLARKIMK